MFTEAKETSPSSVSNLMRFFTLLPFSGAGLSPVKLRSLFEVIDNHNSLITGNFHGRQATVFHPIKTEAQRETIVVLSRGRINSQINTATTHNPNFVPVYFYLHTPPVPLVGWILKTNARISAKCFWVAASAPADPLPSVGLKPQSHSMSISL